MRKFINLLVLIVISFTALAIFNNQISLAAETVNITNEQICSKAPNSPTCESIKKEQNNLFGEDGIITRGVEIVVFITVIGAVLVIIFMGYRIALSGGDAGSLASARKGIIYAVVGLVVAIFAEVIVALVLKNLDS